MAFQKDSTARHDQYYWRCLDCRRSGVVMKKSIRKDSFFQGLRLTVHKVLYLAADFIENPTRHLEEIAESFQIDKNTVSEVHEWFRDLTQQWFVRTIEENPVNMLGGKAKYNRGHMLDRPTVWVFGLLERKTNKIAMFQVIRRDARLLLPIIRRYVKPGTTIISDGWVAYRRISQIPGREYRNKVINHKLHFVSLQMNLKNKKKRRRRRRRMDKKGEEAKRRAIDSMCFHFYLTFNKL